MTIIPRLEPNLFYTTFGPNEPVARVGSGTTLIAETRDARGQDKAGNPLPISMKPRADGFEYSSSNPLVGPVYVNGAEPGDVLAVHIDQIALNRPSAWSSHSPNFGSLTGEQSARHLLLNDPLPRKLFNWSLDLEHGIGTLELPESRAKRIELPLHPFIGSIGVAPRYGRVETALTPGEYGGNMDCVETRAGTTIYFPVWARGAYLSFGDIHAAQGDGEVCGSALETTAEVTLTINVIKSWAIDWPRMEDADFLMTTGSLHSLIDAVRVAQIEMLQWLIAGYGFEKCKFQLHDRLAIRATGIYSNRRPLELLRAYPHNRSLLKRIGSSKHCKTPVITRMIGVSVCLTSVLTAVKCALGHFGQSQWAAQWQFENYSMIVEI